MCSAFDVSKCPPERPVLRVDAATAIGDCAGTCCALVGVSLTGGDACFQIEGSKDRRIEGVYQISKRDGVG